MRKEILVILLLFGSYFADAQTKFGFTAGAQICADRAVGVTSESRLGFNTGFVMRSPLSEYADVHTGLLLSGKGYKYYDSYGYKNLVRPLYLELPLTLRGKFQTPKETEVFLGAGGYLALGIGGKQNYHENGYMYSSKINFGKESELKQTDWGLVFEFGADFRENFEGSFFFDMGLSNILPDATTTNYNRVLGFNLGWFF